MAVGITSNWKLTLDPGDTNVVLLDVGDKLADEVEWDLSQEAIVEPLIRSGTPFLDAGGNRVWTINYVRYNDSDTDAAARQALLVAMLTALVNGPKVLKVEVSGITDRYWTFSAAVVTRHKPTRYLQSAKARRATAWSIVAVGKSQTGP